MAKHYCRQGKKVVVVEPNEMLAEQTGEKLALVDFGITVTSIGRFYLEGPWHEVVILDEYDCILEGSSHLALPSGVRGLWQLRDKQVLAFSATSSLSHERLFGSCIGRPKVLAFKSEFEMLHGANPIAEAGVVVCQDALKLQQQLQADLEKHYEAKPVIVVIDEDQRRSIEELARANKWRWTDTAEANFKLEIRQWDYGLLLLNAEEGRGVDTRFRRAAHVVILAQVQSAH